jgi:hypothetical protein
MAATVKAKSFSTLSRPGAEQVLQGDSRFHRDWGVAFCETDGSGEADGEHWTLLGSHEWVLALQATGRPLAREEKDEAVPVGGLDTTIIEQAAAEWRPEDFRPQWLIRGWPADWADNPLEVFAWPSREAREAIEGPDE